MPRRLLHSAGLDIPRQPLSAPPRSRRPFALAGAILIALALSAGALSFHRSIPSLDAAPSNESPAAQRININTATAAQLESLPGIGPRRATAIIEDRAARGPFPTIESLNRVRGIGPRTIDRLRPYITTTPQYPAIP